MTSTTRTLTAADGTPLLLREWPAPAHPRAALLLLHGLGEHSGRYEHVGNHLAAAGLAVAAPDLRGFGSSGGKPASARCFAEYPADISLVAREIRRRGSPFILFGHSLGGLLALRQALWGPAPDLLVLSAPTLDVAIPGWKRRAARVLGRLSPGLAIPNDIRGNQLSTDPAVGEAYFSDPLVLTRTTAGFGGAWLAAMESTRRALAALSIPTLVIHGERDELVPPSASEPLGRLPGVRRRVLPGLAHECHNEEGGRVALAEITSWLDSRLSPGS